MDPSSSVSVTTFEAMIAGAALLPVGVSSFA